MQTGVGPFFWIKGKIIADVLPLSEAEKYGDKLTSAVSHSDLFDHSVKHGEYILFPRGRVVWDISRNEAVIYLDKCLCDSSIINAVYRTFELTVYRVENDEHYVCPKCQPGNFTHLR